MNIYSMLAVSGGLTLGAGILALLWPYYTPLLEYMPTELGIVMKVLWVGIILITLVATILTLSRKVPT